MALKIVESCVNCWACEPLCPNQAIYEAKPHFRVDAGKCTECAGDFSDAQCAAAVWSASSLMAPAGRVATQLAADSATRPT